jgi:hypothetical protein
MRFVHRGFRPRRMSISFLFYHQNAQKMNGFEVNNRLLQGGNPICIEPVHPIIVTDQLDAA